MKDENLHRTGVMQHHIQHMFLNMRKSLEDNMRLTIKGDWSKGGQGSRLARYMNSPELARAYENLRENVGGYER